MKRENKNADNSLNAITQECPTYKRILETKVRETGAA